MAYRTGYNPAQGAITPEKYTSQGLPSPGPAYYRRGEQPGYIYDPYADKYRPDPKTQGSYYQDAGLVDKPEKKPGMMESIVAPAAVTAGTYALGQAGASYLGAGGAGGGLFGGGAAGTTAGTTAGTGTGAGMLAGETAGTAAAAPAVPTMIGAETVGTGSGTGMLAGETAGSTAGGGGSGLTAGALGTGAVVGAMGAYAGTQGMEAYNKLQNEDTRAEGAAQGYLLSNPFTFWLAPFAGKLGLKDNRWKDERKKFANLAKKDVFIPEPVIASLPTHARSLGSIQEEIKTTLTSQGLPEDYVGFDNNGNWINSQFAKTRDVKDLRAEDIVNYATFAEKDNEWFKKPLQQRLDIANQALQAGAVKEGKGTISVDWKKFEGEAAPTYAAASGNPTLQREQSGATASASNAAKGTRLSPGVYADGKGGTYRK